MTLYSVSLLFQSVHDNHLFLHIINADSEEEALGIAIKKAKEKNPEGGLVNHVIVKHDTSNTIPQG